LNLALDAQPAEQSNSIPSTEQIVRRLETARAQNRSRFRPYEVVRIYKLFGKDLSKNKSEVIARVAFFPPATQTYRIDKAAGMALGEKIVRKILQSENQLLADRGAYDISIHNYTFRFLRQEDLNGRRCQVLEITPLRKDTNLLRGSIWIDAETYLPHRVEGEPAQEPSWWVRDIHVVLDFRDVGGMWLQTGFSSTANVRLLGRYTLSSQDAQYDFGQRVEIEADLIKRSRPDE
jgi:hypothetical protein